MTSMNYQHLFASWPLACGLTARNRLVMAPMTTWSSHHDGRISPDEIEYLRRRSRGVGIVITAACYVLPSGKAFHGQWGCDVAGMLPSLQSAVHAIHEGGALAVLQLHHGGRMSPAALLGHAPHSASAIPAERPDADLPLAMSDTQIQECIDAFANAAHLAAEAGFDGVELHGANTYLLQQFFSPHSNRRDDDWGGDLERRLRFPLAVTDAVIHAAETSGRPFIVGYRVSPEEVERPGITIEDTMVLVHELTSRRLDWLHISARDYRAPSMRDTASDWRPTRRVIDALAGALPCIGVGMVHTADDATFLLDDGCAAVALGRILLMEPEWVQCVAEGRHEDLRHSLPSAGGDDKLTLPEPLYRMLLSREGWLPVNDTETFR
jgi:2,4-dienoyl-CoA reductase-like NADH-dependent reductase (Old Yellow Enzyme family)